MANKQIYQLNETSYLKEDDYIAVDQAGGERYKTVKAQLKQLKTLFQSLFVAKSDWKTSTSSSAGIVAATNGAANAVWSTDASGNPMWKASGASGEWEALIDWKAETRQTGASGATVTWKGNLPAQCSTIYSDGRYAQFVIPLMKPISQFKEICVVWIANISAPLAIFQTVNVSMFEKLMNSAQTTLCSVCPTQMTSGAPTFLPYTGSYIYGKYDSSKSTPSRLLCMSTSANTTPSLVLEIYGRN